MESLFTSPIVLLASLCAICCFLGFLDSLIKKPKTKKLPPNPVALTLTDTFFDQATNTLHVTSGGTPELPEGSTITLASSQQQTAYRTPPAPQVPSQNEPVMVAVPSKGAPGMETHITIEEWTEEQEREARQGQQIPYHDTSVQAQFRRLREEEHREALLGRDFQSGNPDAWVSSTGSVPDLEPLPANIKAFKKNSSISSTGNLPAGDGTTGRG